MTETAIKDLASDFTLAQTLTAEQVVSLEKEFSELTERIKEELPLILNSYLEVASDTKGKRSITEKFIRSAVDNFIKEVSGSDSWIFYSSLIGFNLNEEIRINHRKDSTHKSTRNTPWEELKSLQDSNKLDFIRLISDYETAFKLTKSFSTLPWMPNKYRVNPRMHELTKPVNISKKDLINTSKSKKEQAALEKCLDRVTQNEVSINYFSDPFDLMVVEKLTRDPEAATALAGLFATTLIENIRFAREGKVPQLRVSSKGFDLTSGEETDASIGLIIERHISGLLDHHISETSKKIEAISAHTNTKEWSKLQRAIYSFAASSRIVSESWRIAIKLYLGDQEDLILEEIFTFLSSNNLNPCNIPTIAELGKHKGGYALVKSISEAGGLKSIRKRYVPWSIKKARDLEVGTNQNNDWRNEANKKYDRDEDKIMALYASEANDPGSTGINISLEEISGLMPSESE